MSKVLIVAEHLDGKLNASTARCVTCAKDFKAESIDVLVLAADVAAIAADAAKIDGVAKVLTVARAENAHPLAAVYAPQVAAVAKNGYTHVLFPSTTYGKDVAPRVAALLGVAQVSDIMKAKAKPIETLQLADLGVESGDYLKTTRYAPPAKRSKGVMVKDVGELVAALKSKGLL